MQNKSSKRRGNRPAPTVVTTKKKSAAKLFLTWATVAVAAAALVAGGVLLFGNSYKGNALRMKKDGIVASRLAGLILSDYQENWIKVLTDQLGKNERDEWVNTNDPKQVMEWRKAVYEKNGCIAALDSLVDDMERASGSMKLTPAKFKDVNASFELVREEVRTLAGMTRTPGDSLLEMSSRMSQLMASLGSHLDQSDFDFYVAPEDVNEAVLALGGTIHDKAIVERLTKETGKTQTSAINGIKYRQQGFKELPGGKGVLYKEITKGKGPKAKDDANVTLHYEGKLMDGTVFDSSYKRGQPVTMQPRHTVPGFWHSLNAMQPGAKWQIFIPYAQAYGDKASGLIKPYSDLEFTIEVFSVN